MPSDNTGDVAVASREEPLSETPWRRSTSMRLRSCCTWIVVVASAATMDRSSFAQAAKDGGSDAGTMTTTTTD
jgi:hypothetical protein